MSRAGRVALGVGAFAAVVSVAGWRWLGRSAGDSEFDGRPLPGNGVGLVAAYDAGSRDIVLEMDPMENLPAHALHTAIDQPCAANARIPVDGWVLGYEVEIFDRNGEQLPASVIHHVNIIVPERRELFSPIMQRLGAVGKETGAVVMPRVIGYPVSKGDRIIVSAMLENPTDKSYEGVRVRVRLPYVRSDAAIAPRRIYPFYLDVMPPAGIHEYDLPAGHSEKSWEGKPAVSGRILAMGGHLHKYADVLRLTDVTADKVLYEAKPNVDGDGNIIGMPRDIAVLKGGIPLQADHTYRLTAVYDNPTGQMIPGGAMGALGGILAVSKDAVWPAAVTTDPQYLADVDVTMEGHTHPMPGASSMPGMSMP